LETENKQLHNISICKSSKEGNVQLRALTSLPATKEHAKVKAQHKHENLVSDISKKDLETVVSIVLAWKQKTNSFTSGFASMREACSSELWQLHLSIACLSSHSISI
jgi:hypothetical protein